MSSVIAIIGAGAAGCFAAANIPKQQDRKVILFDKGLKPLQKVKVSGGGRCNVTNAQADLSEFAAQYPRGERLLRKTLHHFSQKDTIDWFQKRGVVLKAEEDGRMFPTTNSSQTIINCLLAELEKNEVEIRYQRTVRRIEAQDYGFVLHFADGETEHVDKVIIAAGGYPKKEQFQWVETLGHKINAPVPSLFTFNLPKHPITALMGVSVPNASVKIRGTKIVTDGPLLITHWGLSGPAVLRASAWGARELAERNYVFTAVVNWLGPVTEEELKQTVKDLRQDNGRQFLSSHNPFALPKRLWQFLLESCGITNEMKWGELPAAQQQKLISILSHHEFEVQGKTTFKEEFVTCGGVALSELDPQTMESRKAPGLYFCGEICDVDGITGGFNFQWAWCSGWLAAKGVV